jgi:hypothetical protein
MIARRITQAIAKQNWSAALVELLIVVIGIFLGLQVSSWYDGRVEADLETAILDRLKVDFEDIRGEIDEAIEFHRNNIDGLDKLQVALDSGTTSEGNKAAVLYSLRNVLNVDTGGGESATYQEVLASGRLRLLHNNDLVSALSEYQERFDNSGRLFSEFRQMQLQYEKDFHQHIYFDRPRRVASRGFLPPDVSSFDLEAMRHDSDFRLALSRLTAFQIYFQIWHWQTQQAATAVLKELEKT